MLCYKVIYTTGIFWMWIQSLGDGHRYVWICVHTFRLWISVLFMQSVCVCLCLADTPDRRISVTLTQHRFVIWKWFRNLVIYDKWVCIPQKQTRWNPKSIYMHFVRLPAHLSPHAWGRARSPRAPLFTLKMNDLCIHTGTCVYIFFIEACLYDSSVTGPSVHTLLESAGLSAPLEWSCLVRQTAKGWGRGAQ